MGWEIITNRMSLSREKFILVGEGVVVNGFEYGLNTHCKELTNTAIFV